MSERHFKESGLAKKIKLHKDKHMKIEALNGHLLKQTGCFYSNIEAYGFVAKNVKITVCEDIKDTSALTYVRISRLCLANSQNHTARSEW